MVDIFFEVFNRIKADITKWSSTAEAIKLLGTRKIATLLTYAPTSKNFPLITFEEKTNIFAQGTLSQSEKFSKLMFEINCYDNIDNVKLPLTRAIAMQIDKTMTAHFGFKRIMCEPMPNTDSAQVYRIISRYDGFIDNEKGTIYKKII